MDSKVKHFLLAALVTIIAVYVLIAVGSSVRATGAGMGCPDWPTCFGQLIPPTSESQLPANYQEIYRDRGYAEVRFNPIKTWTEFFNRLVGAVIGLLSLWTLWAAWRIRQLSTQSLYYAFAAFFMIGFNGWLGSVVVSSHLHPVLITTHMIAALLVVALLIMARIKAQPPMSAIGTKQRNQLSYWLIVAISFSLLQVGFGVQVREQIDIISYSHDFAQRESWVSQVGDPLKWHVMFATIVVAFNLWLGGRLRRKTSDIRIKQLAIGLQLSVLLIILVGLCLVFLSLPAWMQPVHLTLAGLIVGLQVAMLGMLTSSQVSAADKEILS